LPHPPPHSTRPGRSPPPVLDGIQLSGLPWSPAGLSSTTFGLAPRGSAVSSRSPPTSRSPHHRPRWAGSRFCSGAHPLGSRLSTPRVLLRGRNFPRRSPWPVHRLASDSSPRPPELTVSSPSCSKGSLDSKEDFAGNAPGEQLERAALDMPDSGAQRMAERVMYISIVQQGRVPEGPSVHPIGSGRLFAFMEPTSPKAHDSEGTACTRFTTGQY
jgi:hypothetical protein